MSSLRLNLVIILFSLHPQPPESPLTLSPHSFSVYVLAVGPASGDLDCPQDLHLHHVNCVGIVSHEAEIRLIWSQSRDNFMQSMSCLKAYAGIR